jgi:hypothetical protein
MPIDAVSDATSTVHAGGRHHLNPGTTKLTRSPLVGHPVTVVIPTVARLDSIGVHGRQGVIAVWAATRLSDAKSISILVHASHHGIRT